MLLMSNFLEKLCKNVSEYYPVDSIHWVLWPAIRGLWRLRLSLPIC